MDGPEEDFRAWAGGHSAEIDNEEQLDGLLGEIEGMVAADVERGPQGNSAEEDLAAIEAWASLASYAVGRFYAPASSWPRNLAGWSKKAVARLRSIANTLSTALRSVAQALGASSFSIAVNFRWRISIGLSW